MTNMLKIIQYIWKTLPYIDKKFFSLCGMINISGQDSFLLMGIKVEQPGVYQSSTMLKYREMLQSLFGDIF